MTLDEKVNRLIAEAQSKLQEAERMLLVAAEEETEAFKQQGIQPHVMDVTYDDIAKANRLARPESTLPLSPTDSGSHFPCAVMTERPFTAVQARILYWLNRGGCVRRHPVEDGTAWSLYSTQDTIMEHRIHPTVVNGLAKRGLITRTGDKFRISALASP